MADEIKLRYSLTLDNEIATRITPAEQLINQTNVGMEAETVTVNTSASEAISFGNISTPGILYLQSLEATTTGNKVFYGPETSTGGMLKFGVLHPTEFNHVRFNSTTTLRAQADTAAVKVLFQLFEE